MITWHKNLVTCRPGVAITLLLGVCPHICEVDRLLLLKDCGTCHSSISRSFAGDWKPQHLMCSLRKKVEKSPHRQLDSEIRGQQELKERINETMEIQVSQVLSSFWSNQDELQGHIFRVSWHFFSTTWFSQHPDSRSLKTLKITSYHLSNHFTKKPLVFSPQSGTVPFKVSSWVLRKYRRQFKKFLNCCTF